MVGPKALLRLAVDAATPLIEPSTRKGDHMERDLGDEADVNACHLETSRKKDEVRDREVKQWPNDHHSSKSPQGAETPDHEGEEEELRDHGIDSLYRQHEADCLC